MTTKELQERFEPQVVDNQIKFEEYMTGLNVEQSKAVAPIDERLMELHRQSTQIEIQMNALAIQIKTIRLEKNELEAKKKDINRICHELKHAMIQLNPKEKFVKNDNGDE